VSIPSWWQPYVLSVGSLSPSGRPSAFTMAGPWVGIAAPGENVNGTSYAAAYVSGVAALVRSRFPDLTAAQVVRRITASAQGAARSPSNLVGAGALDPVAALTWDIADVDTAAAETRPVAAPAEPTPEDTTPRTIALAGGGALLVVAVATAAIAAHRRKDAS
jgi:membrane-anchored mycosin MYCP